MLTLFMLRLAFALDILRHEEVVAIPDDVGELSNPIAKDKHSGLFGELEVDLDMTMAKDEIVDVGVILDVFLGEEHEVFAILAHIGRFLIVGTLQPAVLGPVLAEPHAPTGMERRESPLTGAIMKNTLDKFEALIGITQPVAMCQEEDLAIKLSGLRLLVEDNTALLFQITVSPNVVVACEVMHLDTHIGEFGEFSQEAGEALGHHIFVFVPEVEHVA